MTQQLAYPNTVRDLVLEYRRKADALPAALQALKDAENATASALTVAGVFALGNPIRGSYIHHSDAERHLLAGAWQAIYQQLNLESVFSANDKKRFESLLADPPELSLENLTATFGQYWENPRYYVLKGLAEVFCSLDPFYKSHDNFGFGVKGLPKRAILSYFRNHGHERLLDMCRAMLQAKPDAWLGEYQPEEERQTPERIIRDHTYGSKDFDIPQLGLTVKRFLNGNAHVYFNKRALELVNDCLHEFYGTVVPDASEDKPDTKQASTAVSADLAFYRTPADAASRLIGHACLTPSMRVLEPSCGDGALLDAIRAAGVTDYIGVEVDAARGMRARAKGHPVLIGNFLEAQLDPFDAVVMNPPFAGQHWRKHIAKAVELLKPGGHLAAILPFTAYHKHREALPAGGHWYDLPAGSFRESGTNVNTGIFIWRKALQR